MPSLTLSGCAPIPLAHYLKALGILRLVSEQKDSSAMGRWHRDQFILDSTLDREALLNFFLDEYQPTPVLSPWNGGSGFYYQEEKLAHKDPTTGKKLKTGNRNQETAATEVVAKILESSAPRLAAYRSTIRATKELLDSKGLSKAPETTGSDKDDLVIELRSVWPDLAVEWLDCVAVLTSSQDAKSKTGLKPSYTTLLGSGANDGNADFTSNFMQRLTEIIASTSEQARSWLEVSIFGDNHPSSRRKALAGQFLPGTAGGANSTAGFSSSYSINPWDYVLLIEGTLFFAAAAVRKHESIEDGSIAYPFCVNTTGSAYASAASGDEKADKSATEEMWLPLWNRACSKNELKTVIGEGRAQLRGKKARSGLDFAQAICSLGTDVGIDSFERMGFLVRNGKSVFATPLGRFQVKRNARIDLISDAQSWINRLRMKTDTQAKPKAPQAVKSALNLVELRIMELCQEDSPDRILSVLKAFGSAESVIARSFSWACEKDKFQRENISPLRGLRPEWLVGINDSAEIRLAASLAGLRCSFGKGKETLWFRQHLEPLKRSEHGDWFKATWSELGTENDVTWHDGDLTDCLNAIMTRRIQRVENAGCEGWPDWSPCYARLDDITYFIEGRIDPALLADLIWGLSLIDWQAAKGSFPGIGERKQGSEAIPSAFYALLKLCFRYKDKESDAIPIVPVIHQLARSGKGKEASRLAARRLRASGEAPLVTDLPVAADLARRTAAALLFPISPSDMKLLKLTLQHQTEEPTA